MEELPEANTNQAMSTEMRQMKDKISELSDMIAILTAMRTPDVPILPPVQPTPQVPPQPPRAVQTEAATSQVTGNVTNPASRIVVSTTPHINGS